MRSLIVHVFCDRAVLRETHAFGPKNLGVPRSQTPRNILYGVFGGAVVHAPALGTESAAEAPPDRADVPLERAGRLVGSEAFRRLWRVIHRQGPGHPSVQVDLSAFLEP